MGTFLALVSASQQKNPVGFRFLHCVVSASLRLVQGSPPPPPWTDRKKTPKLKQLKEKKKPIKAAKRIPGTASRLGEKEKKPLLASSWQKLTLKTKNYTSITSIITSINFHS